MSFETNRGWLVGGEQEGNGAGSLVDKDAAHIPLFYLGTTNSNMGGMALSDMIKVLKTVQVGTLYIKPAFVFTVSNGHMGSMTTLMIAALIISSIRKQKRRALKSLLRQQKRKKRGDRLALEKLTS
jgi:hypothetical protein